MTINVRLFAALRELAGTSSLDADGHTVGDLADVVSAGRGERFEAIVAVSTFVVNGERADRSTVVADGDEVAILPPVSGGEREIGFHRSEAPGRVARSLPAWDTPAMRFHRVLLVVNPVARTVSKPTLAVIEKALSADFALEVAETKEQGHANELAAQAVADGIDLVVVFSGDGTINEVVNALAGTDVALAVLPGGATNVLVRALGLPTDPVECTGMLIPKALDDEAFPLHLGRADGRYFAVNCGAGIDAAAMRRLDKKFPETKAKFDRAAFRAVSWELLVGYAGKQPDLSVSVDGADPFQSLSVMVGRTDPYTFYKERGLRMTPDASLDKGLDVLAIRKLRRRNVPRIAWQVFGSARHVQGRDLDYEHDASHVLVTAAEPFPVQVDGDSLGDHRRLEIELAREALWVVA